MVCINRDHDLQERLIEAIHFTVSWVAQYTPRGNPPLVEWTDKTSRQTQKPKGAIQRTCQVAKQAYKRACRLAGLPGRIAPVGAENSKTAVPGTYRPIEGTCPRSCELFGICYAGRGNVGTHQARADYHLLPQLGAFVVATVAAGRWGLPARLHVSGDFMADNGRRIDREYIQALLWAAPILRETMADWDIGSPDGILAFTYTHIPPEDWDPYGHELGAEGIIVLRSAQPVPGGALVYPHDEIAALRTRYPALRLAKCRAQLEKRVSCADCKLCWQWGKHGLTIVFDPHLDFGGDVERISRKVVA